MIQLRAVGQVTGKKGAIAVDLKHVDAHKRAGSRSMTFPTEGMSAKECDIQSARVALCSVKSRWKSELVNAYFPASVVDALNEDDNKKVGILRSLIATFSNINIQPFSEHILEPTLRQAKITLVSRIATDTGILV